MQNKGFVKVFAIALTLVCLFYLSFSVVTYRIGKKADKYAMVDGSVNQTKREHFIDSISKGTVWLWYDYKSCQKQEINLGLDLKGGMNAILQVEVADVLKQLSEDNQDAGFKKALAEASAEQSHSQEDYVSLFMKHYSQQADKKPLAAIFATAKLRGVVTAKSTDAEIESVLRGRVDDAVNNSFNVLRTRIDRFGVTQPRIQKLENKMGRIMVELPGVKDPERVRKLLQGSANLQFWTTYTQDLQAIAPFVNAAAQIAAEKANQSATTDTAKVEKAEVATDDLKSKLAAETTQDDSAASQVASQDVRVAQTLAIFARQVNSGRGPILGYVAKQDTALVMDCFRQSKVAAPKALALHWGVKAEVDRKGNPMGFALYAIKSSKSNRMLPALEGDVVTDARDEFDQRTSEPVVSMTMNTQGAKKWAKVTKDNINKCVAIVLDGTVYSAPNVNTEITGGNSQISGNFTPEEAKDLANVLKSGRMPAPAKIVSDDIVGPSLGAASIQAGFISFVVALVLLMVYMCMMYGLIPGMIANAALILNFFFTLGILASFQAALTMSGIAGMVLTLGMAVDANVLIYERTKEELRGGKGVKLAITDGYKNALSAIFDSNLTSIITGVILFNFGTGPIRGFATTLIIGIICSFFTAVFMTRLVYEHYLGKDKFLNLTFTSSFSKNMMVDSKFNFMGNSKKSFAIFGVLIVIALGFLFTRGMSQSIDFTGGRNYKVVFDEKVVPENIEKLVKVEIQKVAADENKSADATVSVLALGGDGKTVRVSTNFDIENNSSEADNQMEAILFKALKSKLAPTTTLDDFQNRDTSVGGSIVSSQKVGPTIAEDIKVSAVWSVVLSLLAIALYILFRFRNISYSVGSVLALTSDTLLIMGIYAIGWGWLPFSLEVDQTFIGAILTAIGYSINDKVVIFDRIREFFGLYPNHDRVQIFNDSLNTTLARTISTSVSTLIVLVCIFILGGDSIRSFSFAMILGVVIGTLSSLFLAAPIAYTMQKGMAKKA